MHIPIISSDSHFVEPPDLWEKRLDKKFRDRAPRVIRDLDGRKGDFFVCEELEPIPVAIFFGAGVPQDVYKELLVKGYDLAPASVWDPSARLKDQDLDGVRAEVIYASVGMKLFCLDDALLRGACFRAYNDWAIDYCSHDPKRLLPLGMLTLEDIPAAIAELTRIAGKGVKGAMIWAEPPDDLPYTLPHYEPFWAAAQDLNMKLSLHDFTSKKERKMSLGEVGTVLMNAATTHQAAERSIARLVLGGVLEKYPRLTIVSAENNVSWLPFLMWKMDIRYEALAKRFGGPKLSLKPSEYVKRQVFATFLEEPFIKVGLQYYALENAMWASDYPHTQATWPKSQNYISDTFDDLTVPDRRKLVHDNVARVYEIEL